MNNCELRTVTNFFIANAAHGIVGFEFDETVLALGASIDIGQILGSIHWNDGYSPLVAPSGCSGVIASRKSIQYGALTFGSQVWLTFQPPTIQFALKGFRLKYKHVRKTPWHTTPKRKERKRKMAPGRSKQQWCRGG